MWTCDDRVGGWSSLPLARISPHPRCTREETRRARGVTLSTLTRAHTDRSALSHSAQRTYRAGLVSAGRNWIAFARTTRRATKSASVRFGQGLNRVLQRANTARTIAPRGANRRHIRDQQFLSGFGCENIRVRPLQVHTLARREHGARAVERAHSCDIRPAERERGERARLGGGCDQRGHAHHPAHA